MPTKKSPPPAIPLAPAMPPKKIYTRAFKMETLRLLKSSGKTKVELERELGLYPGQLRQWERAFLREGGQMEQAFPGTGHQSSVDAELRQLRRENAILRQEREILKKVIAIFSTTADRT